MSLTSEVSGWSKFGVGGADAGRTVWRVADNLERRYYVFIFVGNFFKTRYLYTLLFSM